MNVFQFESGSVRHISYINLKVILIIIVIIIIVIIIIIIIIIGDHHVSRQ